MFSYIHWLVHLEHYKDLLREAEQARLARIALSAGRERKAEKKEVIKQKASSKSEGIACCEKVTA